ncbi:MAG TPA: dTDP-glucose 4,6-dehydratase [Bryobacteraceae bacterium]|jgi:dTDP-glucose 4,6-dehydratase|nr:dTDP-glucose 4,6-dehydratase [Bryobacteraceae bacterium]
MKILVTGGAGFIGSCFVRLALQNSSTEIVNIDKLTYAGNLENLAAVADNARYRFQKADLCDLDGLRQIFEETRPDAVVHFAAESHVDRSIFSPQPVFETNLRGTFNLLESMRARAVGRFIHVSTDEVYGSLDAPLEADENFPLQPSSPYSASKAGSDLLALGYFKTYKMPVMVTRASNNYGPYQFPEKLIPLMISNALEDKPLPVYGDGMQVRDWLYVEDHCRALLAILEQGRDGEIYNIGGNRSVANRWVIEEILAITGKPASLMTTVTDRPGHDRRYALSSAKLSKETGWSPQMDFERGLKETVDWYRTNHQWVRDVKSGEYQSYYARNYDHRASELDRARA